MATVGKGAKIKLALQISGLNEYAEDVKFKLDFYAKGKKDIVPSAFYTVSSDDDGKVFEDEAEDYVYYVICDTTGLDSGTLAATLTITYKDGDGSTIGTGAEIKEISTVVTDIRIEDAFVAPLEVDPSAFE